MIEGSNASALLGLHGMVMTGIEVADEVTITIETTADRVGCHRCGVIASLHDRRRVRVRDLEIAGRPTVLIWNKRIWRCRERLCSVCTWTERHDAIAPRASLTVRAGVEMCRRVGRDGDSIAAVGRDFGVGWACVMNAVEVHGRRLVDDPGRIGDVTQLGLDETAFQRPSKHRGHTSYVTGFVDLTRPRLLDVVADRTGAAVDSWLSAQPTGWLAGIAEVALDPHRGYFNGLTSTLPHATVVVDRFHAVGLANRAVDDVRRRVQNETLGHRGRSGDPLYAIRRLLLRGYERLSDRQLQRLEVGLVGDRYGEVGAAWMAKELCREIYTAVDLAHARRRLIVFYDFVAQADVAELVRLAKTISAWETEILAFHTTGGLSNGPTEGINLLIKKIKRVGHGFRNFDNYRLRLLLHAGVDWHTPPTARLRGHPPRSAA
jgi:transposase